MNLRRHKILLQYYKTHYVFVYGILNLCCSSSLSVGAGVINLVEGVILISSPSETQRIFKVSRRKAEVDLRTKDIRPRD